MEINKLSKRLLDEGWTEDQTPPGCKPWNRFYGGWTYDYRRRLNVVFEAPCGLIYQRNDLSHSGHMSYMGVEWMEENDCMTVICPYYSRSERCTLNHPLLEQQANAGCHYESLHFCAVHETSKPYSYETSAQKVIDLAKEEQDRLWDVFLKKHKGRACIHQSRYNRKTKEWSICYSPDMCPRYGCVHCDVLNRDIDISKKGNVFYDEKWTYHIESNGFFEEHDKTTVIKGKPLFGKPIPLDLCEAIVKYGLRDIKWRLRMNHHTELYFHPELKIEFLNFRAEKKVGRDLLKDLEDVENGITVIHEADKKKSDAAAKKQRKTEMLQRKKQSMENKIRKGGLKSFNGYQRERLEKVLGEDRCYELDAEYQKKQAEQQISLFELESI